MKKMVFISSFLLIVMFTFSQTPVAKDSLVLISLKGDTIKLEKDEKIFVKVEVESEFPGGVAAWQEFLLNNLNYPKKAVRKNIQGEVILQFIVCSDGTICNLEAISGPEVLREAAIKALKNTPTWIPATQDGTTVKSYKKQPIVFRIE